MYSDGSANRPRSDDLAVVTRSTSHGLIPRYSVVSRYIVPRDAICRVIASASTVRPAALPRTIRPMTETRLWDRAAVAVVADGRRFPAVAALGPGCRPCSSCSTSCATPSCASRRYACGSSSGGHRRAARTRRRSMSCCDTRDTPGSRRAGRARSWRGDYEIWISDGEIVRTYVGPHKLGTQRPIRNRPRGLDDPDFPGMSRVYEPSPASRWRRCPRRSSIRRASARTSSRPAAVRSPGAPGQRSSDDPPALRPSADRRAAGRPARPLDGDLRSTATTGVIVRLVETIGGSVTRDATASVLEPDAPLPPSAFDFASRPGRRCSSERPGKTLTDTLVPHAAPLFLDAKSRRV